MVLSLYMQCNPDIKTQDITVKNINKEHGKTKKKLNMALLLYLTVSKLLKNY